MPKVKLIRKLLPDQVDTGGFSSGKPLRMNRFRFAQQINRSRIAQQDWGVEFNKGESPDRAIMHKRNVTDVAEVANRTYKVQPGEVIGIERRAVNRTTGRRNRNYPDGGYTGDNIKAGLFEFDDRGEAYPVFGDQLTKKKGHRLQKTARRLSLGDIVIADPTAPPVVKNRSVVGATRRNIKR